MRQPWITAILLVHALLANSRPTCAQTSASPTQSAAPYNLSIAVDEVSVTFHAADARGFPIHDLQLDELSLLDNGKPPRKILSFQSLEELPIRAGILIDTSKSMEDDLPGDRAIAIKYARKLLRKQTDQAFVMDFDFTSKIAQPWTNDPAAIATGMHKIYPEDAQSRIGGTAIFDSIYRACLNQFGHIDHPASGNFILLFSDGEDNASHAYLKEAVDICQRSNTAVYAFRAEPKEGFSSGPKTLAELASETGGRVFPDDQTDSGIDDDLRMIEADLRNRYRLVYKPSELKHDGSFHRIQLKASKRVDSIIIRSGYYAPAQ